MIEKYLIEYCSPTLARLKTANLFSISYTDREELSSQISICNQQLNEKESMLPFSEWEEKKP